MNKKLYPRHLLLHAEHLQYHQIVNLSTGRWWVIYFSNEDSDVSDKPHSTQLSTHEMKCTLISWTLQIRSMKDGQHKIFSYSNGLKLLVQILMRETYLLLFFASGNAWLMIVVIQKKNHCFVAGNLLYNKVLGGITFKELFIFYLA